MASPTQSRVQHLFTVDVEEYFQVSAFDAVVSRDEWTRLPSRVERSVDELLSLLAKHGAHGTFFTLGWIAEHHPAVVRRIHEAGHEIASHGYWHRRIPTLTPEQFREDVRSSKAILEDVTGQPVVGYRAPSFSILHGLEWALDTLIEEGYRYDSSLFPVHRPGYGYAGIPTYPHAIQRAAGSLVEFPPATLDVAGARIPAAGGGYLRQFPFAVVRQAFRVAQRRGIPATFYIHPWELDPDQPRLAVSRLTAIRHYRGLSATAGRIDRLLQEFSFTSIARHTRGVSEPVFSGSVSVA